jgi:hypothetical protein
MSNTKIYDTECNNAVADGNFDKLKSLRADGYNWSASTAQIAAENGNLDILQYLVQNGCHMTVGSCVGGLYSNNQEVFDFTLQNQPWKKDFGILASHASALDDLDNLKKIIELGYDLNGWCYYNATIHNNNDMIKLLELHNCSILSNDRISQVNESSSKLSQINMNPDYTSNTTSKPVTKPKDETDSDPDDLFGPLF